MPTAFKQVADNALGSTQTDLSSAGITSIRLLSGQGVKFPQPGNGFIITLWDIINYPTDPSQDPHMEKLVCSARSGDVLTIAATTKTHPNATGVGLLDVASNTTDLQTAVNTAEANISTNAASITTEATTRATADTTLQTNITNEATARANADALKLAIASNLSDLASAPTARTNLGLGSMATQSASAVAITGGTITGLGTPSASADAAPKSYVDSVAQGLDVKASVRVATTANITLSGTQTIDGVAVIAGDRVLVKNQTTGSQNGIYVVAAGAWSRSADATTSAQVTSGLFTFVTEGTVGANNGFVLTTADPITVGTTSLTFTQFSGAGEITAGNGIAKSGNTLSIDTAVVVDRSTSQTIGGVKTFTSSPVVIDALTDFQVPTFRQLANRTLITIGLSAGANNVPDGVDDNLDFKAAHDALPATGGKIYVYGGTYNFSTFVPITKNNVEIELAPGAVIKMTSPSTNGAFVVRNSGATQDNVWIHGGTTDLNSQANTQGMTIQGSTSDGTQVGSTNIIVSKMKFKNKANTSTSPHGFIMVQGPNSATSFGRLKNVLIQDITADTSDCQMIALVGDYFTDLFIDRLFASNGAKDTIQLFSYNIRTHDNIRVTNSHFTNTTNLSNGSVYCDFNDGTQSGGKNFYWLNNVSDSSMNPMNLNIMSFNLGAWDTVYVDHAKVTGKFTAFSISKSHGADGFWQDGNTEVFITNSTFEYCNNLIDGDATFRVHFKNNTVREMNLGGFGLYSEHTAFFNEGNLYYNMNNMIENDAYLTANFGVTAATLQEYQKGAVFLGNSGQMRTFRNNTIIDDRAIQDPGAVAPTLSAPAGGALGSRTYYVKFTYANASGETLASNESTLALSANTLLRVTNFRPAGYNTTNTTMRGIKTINIYAGTTAGAETLQASLPYPNYNTTNQDTSNASAGWTEPTTGLVAGTALPGSNTTHALTKYGVYFLDGGGINAGNDSFSGNRIFGTKLPTGTNSNTQIYQDMTDNYFNGVRLPDSVSTTLKSGNSFKVELAAPGTPTATPSTTGGTLAAGTYYYRITGIDIFGAETSASMYIAATTTGSTGSVALSWSGGFQHASYRIYRGTKPFEETLYYTSATNSYTDTNAASTAGTAPYSSAAILNRIAGSGASHIDELIATNKQGRSTNLIVKGNSTNGGVQPDSLSGLKLWLKADALGLSDGNAVSTWTDSSGTQNATQATGGNQPIFKTSIINGLPVVRFNGSSSFLGVAGLNAGNAMTMFVVTAPTSTTVDGLLDTAPNQAGTFRNMHTSTWEWHGSSPAVPMGIADTNPVLMTVQPVLSGTRSINYWRNTILAKSQAYAETAGIVWGATPQIGRINNGDYYYSGDVAEVVVFNRALTTLERQQVENYLVLKYGLSGGTMIAATANLQQWQDDTGAVKATMDPLGNLSVPSLTPTTPLAITGGGTGASTASGARTNLGLAIGSNVEAWSARLDTLAGTTDTGTGAIVRATSPALTTPTGIVKGDVGLGNVDNTSDATKNAATVALTNKDLTGAGNTFPTFNQNTTGSAAKLTTARTIAGTSFDGSANISLANKFIVQGTADTGLSAAQFLGALGTGILKNTTTTGILSIAVAGDFPTLNQSTTGSAATLTTPRSIYGNNFDGSAALAQIIASTFGGTGNGFTKFSGPATSEKTFTLPNASATVLTDNAAVTIPQGGTGVATLPTGILKGAGTGAITAVTAPSGAVLGDTDTQTLTNKRITIRVSTTASSATPTPNSDTTDEYTITALAAGATFGAPTGTPTEGQRLMIRIKDNGSAQTLAWNAIYRASSDLALPTTTIISKTMYVGFAYNNTDTKWDFVAFLNNF